MGKTLSPCIPGLCRLGCEQGLFSALDAPSRDWSVLDGGHLFPMNPVEPVV